MVLAELTTYLASQGIGVEATTLFYGYQPPDPDACVCLFEYGGLPNEPDMGKTTVRLEFPRINVRVRGLENDYDGPRQKIQDVITAFTKIGNQTISGISYKAVMALQSATPLGRDGNGREEFSCNFQVTKGYSAT